VTDNPQHRLREHLGRERKSPSLKDWLEELQKENLKPVFVFLDSIKTKDALQTELEWIDHFQKLFPLLNHKKK